MDENLNLDAVKYYNEVSYLTEQFNKATTTIDGKVDIKIKSINGESNWISLSYDQIKAVYATLINTL